MKFDLAPVVNQSALSQWADGRSDENDLVSALEAARGEDASSPGLVPSIAGLLRTTTSQRVRDAAALTLADLGDARGADVLVEVLRRPEIAKAAGTLLHALDEMSAELPIDILETVVSHGSYEARAMAISMLAEGRVSGMNPTTEAAARRSFTKLSASDDVESAEAGQAALQGLDVRGQGLR